jgi:hypothetical protein
VRHRRAEIGRDLEAEVSPLQPQVFSSKADPSSMAFVYPCLSRS